MGRPWLQISVATMLGLVACVAVNLWLFRVGMIWGLIGLNVTKHVGVAVFCQAIGVNRRSEAEATNSAVPGPHISFSESP